MKSTLRLGLFAVAFVTATASSAQQLTPFEQSYRSTYMASCTREFASAPGGAAANRGTEICTCIADSLVSNLDDKQLQQLDDQISKQGTKSEAFSLIREVSAECAKADVPAKVAKDPGHLKAALQKYPGVFK